MVESKKVGHVGLIKIEATTRNGLGTMLFEDSINVMCILRI